jgi:hypothetical protein
MWQEGEDGEKTAVCSVDQAGTRGRGCARRSLRRGGEAGALSVLWVESPC